MAEIFQIGEIVTHKAKNLNETTLQMTIHCFLDDNPNNRTNKHQVQNNFTNWAVCQWYVITTSTYQQNIFHISELQKIA